MNPQGNGPLRGDPYGGHPPFERSSDTSKDAADDIEDVELTLEELVYRFVSRQGEDGATVDEVEEMLDMIHQTAGPRVRTLVLKGRLKNAKRTRMTRQNRRAYVWVRSDIEVPRDAAPPEPIPDPVPLVPARTLVAKDGTTWLQPSLSA